MTSASVKSLCVCCLCAIAVSAKAGVPDKKENSRVLNFRPNERKLSYPFSGDVDDVRNIDLDLRDMCASMAMGSVSAFADAREIYSLGGYSEPYATLSVTNGLANKIDRLAEVTGETTSGNQAKGVVMENVVAGATEFKVRYASTAVCYVGKLKYPKTDGCFVDSSDGSKTVTIGADTISYDYTALEDTTALLSLKKISEQSSEVSPSAIYGLQSAYSDSTAYANDWIIAALIGDKTTFSTDINFDFSKLDFDGRSAAVKSGVAGVSVWPAVISRMQQAVEKCASSPNDAIKLWDEAVALYSGQDTQKDGYFLESMALQECKYYGTCKDDTPSPVTVKIINHFTEGKSLLVVSTNCAVDTTSVVKEIQSTMYIPLIQGVLRMAYEFDVHNSYQQMFQGRAAAMAASIAPALHSCSTSAAQTVLENVKPGKAASAKYETMRLAIEQQYGCLGITCVDVGGLTSKSPSREYLADAKPCTEPGKIPDDDEVRDDDDHEVFSSDVERDDDDHEVFSSDVDGTGYNKKKSDSADEKDQTVGIAVGTSVGAAVFFGAIILMIRMSSGKKESDEIPVDEQSDLDLDEKNEERFVGDEAKIV